MEVVLIRHTRTAADRDIVAGWNDVALAATFPTEAQSVVARVRPRETDRVLSSPSFRCLELAKLLGEPSFEPRLREMHFGEWEGRRWSEIPSAEINPWMADFVSVAPPGGESARDLSARVEEVLAELDRSAERWLLIAHAGVLRAAAAHFLGLPLENIFRLACEPGAILRARRGAHGWELLDWRSSPSE